MCIITAVLISTLSIPAFAANTSFHLILGVGRTSVLYQSGNSVKLESLEKTPGDMENNSRVPRAVGGSTYVSLRYLLEAASFAVDWDEASSTIIIKSRSGSSFPFWIEDTVKGSRNVNATKIEYKNDVFTVTVQGSSVTEKIKIAPSRQYFGRTYLPVREFERFGFIIHWDESVNVVHIVSDTTNDFKTAFEDIFKETNATYKGAKASTYVNGLRKSDSFYQEYERYISNGTECNNYDNNSLALKTSDGLFLSIISNSASRNNYTAVASGSRQLTYAAVNGKKIIYYISKFDKQIYKAEYNRNLGKEQKVLLPKSLDGKSFSQLIINGDRIFFIAFDNARDGGNVYMARVGDEEKTTVKLTKNKAWNIVLTPNYRLYYTDFANECKLYYIDLKNSDTLTKLANDPTSGIEGTQRHSAGIQSIAFSNRTGGTFYYTDIRSGCIVGATANSNGALSTRDIIKPSTPNVLFNFLNLYEVNDDRILYYIEYSSGKINNFEVCKIMAHDLYTGETKTAYVSDKMIMQLTLVDKSIYFTDESYENLYRLDISDKGYVFTVM